ncbi:MAG: hypothetical protein HC876_03695 [Chloroflexaceae bacterium]|nr:hypothetical protein [Chloroflexaceae bacterium]NJO04693.1 hypothetical protein [Chloroflexaceae bacterium]
MCSYNRTLQRAFAVFCTLLLLTLLPTATAPAQADSTAERSGVVVVAWPTPSIQVRAGDMLTYQFQAKNFNRNGITTIRMYMPYDPDQITILNAESERPADWLSELGKEHIVVTFGEFEGGETYTVRVNARVKSDLPAGTVINAWVGYSWVTPGGTHGPKAANAAPVLVGDTNIDSPYVWMNQYPQQAPADTIFGLYSDRFVPGELVEVMVTAPDGSERVYAREAVNSQGQVWLSVYDAGFAPGVYTATATGLLSNLRGVVTFEVTP